MNYNQERAASAEERLAALEARLVTTSEGAEASLEAHRAEADRLRAKAAELTAKLEAATARAGEEKGRSADRLLEVEEEAAAAAAAAAAEAAELKASLEKAKDKAATLKGEKKKVDAMMKELAEEVKFALETGEKLQKELQEKEEALGAASRSATEAQAAKSASDAVVSGLEDSVAEARGRIGGAEEARDVWMKRFNEERVLRQKLGRKITELQGNIRVLCRVRPLNGAEKANGGSDGLSCVDILDSERMLLQGSSHTFDGVFGPESTQEGVFIDVQPTVVSALEGFNVCVFAYGQ